MPNSKNDGKYYMLVNPYIEGSLPKIYKAENSNIAAKSIYKNLSKYFNNNVSKFNFTLLKLKSDSIEDLNKFNLKKYSSSNADKVFNSKNFTHFTVNETLDEKQNVNFNIEKINKNIDNLDKLMTNIINIQTKFKQVSKQNGGSKSDSDDDSEDGKHSKSKSKSRSKFDDDDDDSPDYYVQQYNLNPMAFWYYAAGLYDISPFSFPMFTAPLSAPILIDSYYPLLPLALSDIAIPALFL